METLPQITLFFKWCTILNAAFLLYTFLMLMLLPDFVYRLQSRWFQISRDTFNNVTYAFLGLFKLFFIVFSLVPYLALLIMV